MSSRRERISERFGRLALAVAFVAAAGGAMAADAAVAIENFVFLPAELTVKAGAKVVFVNRDEVPHSVYGFVSGKEKFQSDEQLDKDDIFEVVFDAPGEIDIRCGVHSAMKGKVRVTP